MKWHPNERPTAVPKPKLCPVCMQYTTKWAVCKIHERWECPKHPASETHGVMVPMEK